MNKVIDRVVFCTFILLCIFIVSCEKHEKDIPASKIYTNMPEDGYEVEVNDTLILSPKITYDYNSEYQWIKDDKNIGENKDYEYIPKILEKVNYTFKVSNDRGNDEIDFIVQSIYKTDFEEIISNDTAFKEDTFWTNSQSITTFNSDQLTFNVTGSYLSDTWTGFTYSNLTGGNTIDDYEKYSCYKKPTKFDSDIFGVILLDAFQNPVSLTTKDGEDHLFKSISINNSYYVYDAINNEEHGSKRFSAETKDWLKLTITGFNKAGTQRGSVEIMLADYTSGSVRDNTILDEWTTFNLESIGSVNKLEFVMTSSDTEGGKMNTPPFVCFDEIKIIE